MTVSSVLKVVVASHLLASAAAVGGAIEWAQPTSGAWRNPASWIGGVVPGDPALPAGLVRIGVEGESLYTAVIDDDRRVATLLVTGTEANLRVHNGGMLEVTGTGLSDRPLWLTDGVLLGGSWSLPGGLDLSLSNNRIEGVTFTDPEGLTIREREFNEDPAIVRIEGALDLVGDRLTVDNAEVSFIDTEVTLDSDIDYLDFLGEGALVFETPNTTATFQEDLTVSTEWAEIAMRFSMDSVLINLGTLSSSSENWFIIFFSQDGILKNYGALRGGTVIWSGDNATLMQNFGDIALEQDEPLSIDGRLENEGTVLADGGYLTLVGAAVGGDTAPVTNTGTITIHNGVIEVTVYDTPFRNEQGGVTVMDESQLLAAGLVNAGELRVFDSVFEIDSLALEQTSTVIITLTLGNDPSWTVTGDAALDGDLTIVAPDKTDIAWGDQYELLRVNGERSGAFASVLLPEAPAGIAWVAEWADDSLLLRARDAADLNDDGAVDFADLNTLLAEYGNTGGAADIDGDGEVGFADLNALLSRFGATAP